MIEIADKNFPQNLQETLKKVIASLDAKEYEIREPERSESINVQKAFASIDVNISISQTHQVWELVSLNMCAGWLSGAESQEGALGGIIELCTDVQEGQGYAGFSGYE